MGAITKTLYETDFAEWSKKTAGLIRAGRLQEVDLEHVAEEIESLSGSEERALFSQLQRVMTHLLKIRCQPEYYARHRKSWDASIRDGRQQVLLNLERNHSLRKNVAEYIVKGYDGARVWAEKETGLPFETFPEQCPFTDQEVLGPTA